MVDLANDLTLNLEMIVFDLKDERVEIQFRLRPTIGTVVQEQVDKDRQMVLMFDFAQPENQTIIDILKVKNVSEIKAWLVQQYKAYVADPEAEWDSQLFNLFTYVSDIGIKS